MSDMQPDLDVERWLASAGDSLGAPPAGLREQVFDHVFMARALAAVDVIAPPPALRARVESAITADVAAAAAGAAAAAAPLPAAAAAAAPLPAAAAAAAPLPAAAAAAPLPAAAAGTWVALLAAMRRWPLRTRWLVAVAVALAVAVGIILLVLTSSTDPPGAFEPTDEPGATTVVAPGASAGPGAPGPSTRPTQSGPSSSAPRTSAAGSSSSTSSTSIAPGELAPLPADSIGPDSATSTSSTSSLPGQSGPVEPPVLLPGQTRPPTSPSVTSAPTSPRPTNPRPTTPPATGATGSTTLPRGTPTTNAPPGPSTPATTTNTGPVPPTAVTTAAPTTVPPPPPPPPPPTTTATPTTVPPPPATTATPTTVPPPPATTTTVTAPTTSTTHVPPTTPPPAATYACLTTVNITETSAVVSGVTTDPRAVAAQFVLTPRDGIVPDDVSVTIGGELRVFESTATRLHAHTSYSVVVVFRDAAGNTLGASAAGGCQFTTLLPLPVNLCVAATAVAQTSATIGGSTSHHNAEAARFTLVPPVGTAPDDVTVMISGGNRAFETTATGLLPGTLYTFVVVFLDANRSVVGLSAGGGCQFLTLGIGLPR